MRRRNKELCGVLAPDIDGRTREAKKLKADAVARDRIAAELRASLGRKPNAFDEVAIKNIARNEVETAEAERAGRDTFDLRKQTLQYMRGLGLKPSAPVAAKESGSDWDSWLAEHGEAAQ